MYKIGDKIDNFKLTRIMDCKGISGTLYQFEHVVNGAKVLWMKTDDNNKLFSVAFRTIPVDDTGVFHILEHSVLNGSEKYPVKEPFVDLLKSSMNTFLNAMTYGDKTVYPVSSRNQKDLFNLMDVYLDAVFAPKIYENPNIFYQEGWHYELKNPKDEPIYKGVVFNEMKGALSGVDAKLEIGLYTALFGDSCYGRESGGKPEKIPELTYENFVATHKKFYHPSNAVFYLDGDMDFEGAVHKISAYVDKYERGESFFVQNIEPLKPVKKEIYYDYQEDDPENNAYLVLGRILPDDFGMTERSLASMSAAYFAGTNVSPLKKEILERGLATNFTVSVETEIKQPVLTIRADNVNPANVQKIKDTIREIVGATIKNGADKKEVNALLNVNEFNMREVPSFRGMTNMNTVLNCVNYERDIEESYDFETRSGALRNQTDAGRFEEVLEAIYDLDKMTEVVALPSKTVTEEEIKKEKERLAEIKKTWSEKDISDVIKLNENLEKWQASEDKPEDSAKIPKLELSDVSKNIAPANLEEITQNGIKVLYHKISGKGTAYINFYFGITVNSAEELSLVATIPDLLTNLPTENYTLKDLACELKTFIGNFSTSVIQIADIRETDRTTVFFKVSISVLEKYFDKAFELAIEVITRTKFNDKELIRKRIKQCVEMAKLELRDSGHMTAISLAGACETANQYAEELLCGFTQYRVMKDLVSDFDNKFDGYRAFIEKTLSETVCSKRLTIGLTSADVVDFAPFVNNIPSGKEYAKFKPTLPEKKSIGVAIPAGIAYAARVSNYRLDNENHSGSMGVAANILGLSHLWNEIRVKGGAYGAGLAMRKSGQTIYYTYRDPSPKASLETFDTSPDFLRSIASSGEPLDQFIISTVADTEPLRSARAFGSELQLLWFGGISQDDIQRTRDEILGTTAADLVKTADILEKARAKSNFAVVGEKELVAATNPEEIFEL